MGASDVGDRGATQSGASGDVTALGNLAVDQRRVVDGRLGLEYECSINPGAQMASDARPSAQVGIYEIG